MSGILQTLIASIGGAINDTYFNLVTLLLPGNGTNGAQNNTFLDSSTNNFTITRNGNTTQGTFSPFSQTGWSNYFDGTNDFLQKTSPSSALYDWTSTNWTLEFWIYANAFGQGANTESNVFGNATDSGATSYWTFGTISTGAVKWYYYNGGSVQITTTTTLSTGRWYHLAFVNNSNNLTIYIDGVSSATGTKSGTPQFSSGTPITLGKISSSFNGYISNLRITQSAVYTSGFTPSTTPLTAISGTQLLMCQSNRFLDNSTNAVVFTPSGDVSVQAFSPFAPTAAYSAATVGGSGYFDGSGDYLSFASNAAFTVGTGDLTIEAWIYVTSLSQAYQGIASGRADTSPNFPGLGLTIDNSQLLFTILNSGSGLRDSANVPLNQWVHVVGVRSGTNAALFVNGTRKASSTNSENGTSSDMVIGRYYVGTNNYYLSGYISGARLLKGTAAYDPTQTSITVPTAPFTNVTNTSFLTNFTNAGITDATAKNDLETVGNAQISTTQSKFGGGSMSFDGTGDYLFIPQSNNPLNLNWEFLKGDFTIEFWFRANSVSPTNQGMFVKFNGNASLRTDLQLGIFLQGSNLACNAYQSTTNNDITFSSAISINTWYHVAFVRSGTSVYAYLDGARNATIRTITGDLNSGTTWPLQIGRYTEASVNYDFNGYIDDLRVTKFARYSGATITVPSAAFPLQ